jgi:hypothetical protein
MMERQKTEKKNALSVAMFSKAMAGMVSMLTGGQTEIRKHMKV